MLTFRTRPHELNVNSSARLASLLVSFLSLLPEQKRAELVRESGVNAAPGTDHAYFYSTSRGLYLLLLKPFCVALVRALRGEPVAEIPANEPVSALAMSGDGTTLGVATPGRVTLWRLVNHPDTCE